MKRFQYFFNRFCVSGVPILKVIFNIARNNWALIIILFLLYTVIFWLVGHITAFCIFITFVLVILYYIQDNLLFHPDLPPHSRVIVAVPSIFGLPYESVNIWTADKTRLHLFILTQPKSQSEANISTILYLHGNAGNVGHRLQNAAELYQKLQCNIVLLEYRGYGLSKGRPAEHGLYQDVRSAIDYISTRSDLNANGIIIFGRSLGGAVGIDVAVDIHYDSKIWCLILENTFTNIPDMANVLLGWRLLKKMPLFFYKSKFLSSDKITKMKVPTLFISGLADTLVPPRMMEHLHQICSSTHKKLVVFPKGSHNETWNCQGYYNAIATFLQEVTQNQTKPSASCESTRQQTCIVKLDQHLHTNS